MDIRDWPVERIMQLPDWCFGQRFPVSVASADLGITIHHVISQLALPERFVIWEIVYTLRSVNAQQLFCCLALGDVEPVLEEQFIILEYLVPGLGRPAPDGLQIDVASVGSPVRVTMRKPVHCGGRRLVGRFEVTAATPWGGCATVIISSFPTEVPDWLISGHLRSR